MSYRKFRAEQLFTGIEMLGNEQVLITNTDGEVLDLIETSEPGDDIEEMKGILCPGFVNCHCHLELSHIKGAIPEKSGMVDFLLAVMRQRKFEQEEIQSAIEKAETEMLENGIVAVGDICNTIDTVAQKNQGRMYYHNFIEATGFMDHNASQRFDLFRMIFEQFAQYYGIPIASNSIVPHSPYSVSNNLFQRIVDFPGNHIISMHNQEHASENDLYRSKEGDMLRLYSEAGIAIDHFQSSGHSSLQTTLPSFYRNQRLILVHNVETNQDDITSIQNSKFKIQNLHFCLCPNANLYINDKLPDVDMLMKNNCHIVLGTDSLASNHQLSILEEIRTLRERFSHLETGTLLQWATLNGAQALELDGVIGSFEKGKQPGVINISSDLFSVKRIL